MRSTDGLAGFQDALVTSRAYLVQIEIVTDPYRAVEGARDTRPDVVVVTGLDALGTRERADPPAPRHGPGRRGGVLGRGRIPVAASRTARRRRRRLRLKEDGPEPSSGRCGRCGRGHLALAGYRRPARRAAGGRVRADDGSRVRPRERRAEELDSLTTAKADFIANVSHELGRPVTIAKGIAYVLRNPDLGEGERAEFIEPARGLAGQAHRADRRDARRGRHGPRDALARDGGVRSRARVAADRRGRRPALRRRLARAGGPEAARGRGGSDPVHGDRAPAARQRLPVLARG